MSTQRKNSGATAARAADTLGMSRATLYRTLRHYGIRRVG